MKMLFDKLSSVYLANTSWLPGIASGKTPNSQEVLNEVVNKDKFIWDKITPNASLVYHDCFDGFQCARLQVPMDWTASFAEDNRTVELAVIRIPATVPVTDPSYGGAVIINPGGPGGSGVNFALRDGVPIQTIISAPLNSTANGDKHFDVISFDPRGVNNTTPYFACFPDSVQMTAFQLEAAENGALSASDTAFSTEWARIRALAEDCSRRALDAGIGEFMTTASVARDIIEIAERHGEWREAEAMRLLSASPSSDAVLSHKTPTSPQQVEDIVVRTQWKKNEEMVLYWGFSYGTILGATLSAMFPTRIGRAVLDGVCDSFDYMEGGWLTNLQDTDIQITKFGEYCYFGGPEHCALYHEDGPAAIVDIFVSIIKDLKINPIGVPARDGYAGGVATYSDLKQMFWYKTYRPLRHFHELARVMDELRKGNGTGLVQSRFEKRKALEKGVSEECREQGPYSRACFDSRRGWDTTAGSGILCSDAKDQTNMTKSEFWNYVEELMDQSMLMGDVWGNIRLTCTKWNVRPKTRYEGNFTATTANPILFVSNTADNVTPLRNAIKMSAGFPGSTILQQDSEGHCSAAAPSFCTAAALRAYFQTGELPKEGTICSPERKPLDGFSEEDEPKNPGRQEDESVWRAMVAMNKS